MYRNYVLKRLFYGLMMYVVMVFTYSILFNNVAEQTQRSWIEEQIVQEMQAVKNLNESQHENLVAQKRVILIHQSHLDQPLVFRIVWRSLDTLAFNYGHATNMQAANGDKEVISILLGALPNTLLLFTTQVILTLLIGIPLGLYAARRPNGWIDRTTSTLTMITNGLPAWWLGMLMIMTFAYGALSIFPSGGLHTNPPPGGFMNVVDLLWHLALPLLTLVLLSIWGTAYLTRNIVLGNLQEDFVMAARARGIPENKVLLGHALRTSLPAIMTLAVLSLFSSISGNIIFEGIFGWPGLGMLYFVAVQQNDIPVLMANLALQTLINMVGFILLDLIYGWLDPRIKVGSRIDPIAGGQT